MKPMTRIVSTGVAALLVIGGITTSFFASKNLSQTDKHSAPAKTRISQSSATSKLVSLQKRETTIPNMDEQKYHAIPVVNADGHKSTLDIANNSVVFLSDWNATQILNQLKSAKLTVQPILVVTWPSPNETPRKELLNVIADAKDVGLPNQVVELTDTNHQKWVTGVPDAYVFTNNKVYEVPGILPKSTDWNQVFHR